MCHATSETLFGGDYGVAPLSEVKQRKKVRRFACLSLPLTHLNPFSSLVFRLTEMSEVINVGFGFYDRP